MEPNNKDIHSIDEYIRTFPTEVQRKLQLVKQIIKETAPDTIEAISYQMPTFKLKGNLVHFAAFKYHVGFYPIPSGIKAFKSELSKYKSGKGSVQFPLNEPMPLNLIRRIVEFRVRENLSKTKSS